MPNAKTSFYVIIIATVTDRKASFESKDRNLVILNQPDFIIPKNPSTELKK